MPYRRLPKTDAARLKALKTLLENNEIYTVRNKFIDWKLLNQAQPLHDRLLTAIEQYRISMSSQVRNAKKMDGLQKRALMYLSHFIQVLLMSVERGEIKRSQLVLYGFDEDTTTLPNLKNNVGLLEWGPKVIEGEKARQKKGGRPIYNPSIGMVSTHFDIYQEVRNSQKRLQQRTFKAHQDISKLRPEIDELLLELWNAIENHFAELPPEQKFNECRKFGVVYYYRRHEENLY
ncbi:hypothetical protein [Prevotella sp. HUN102]|uniref:hypothetical protein n=1 Tax=Prevotella sp. HUN102 TaxID=1392486 RepID=UPI00048DDF6C|nr:hypothetical protein [Prevotella sp. HUN102]